MPTQRKIAVLKDLEEKMSRMQLAIVADYRGMTVAEITDLRRKIRESGAEVVIAKNTLLRMAARSTGHEELEPLLVGPTAITFGYDDVAKVAKSLNEYLRESKKFSVRGGALGHSPLAEDGLEQVAKMPSRESLLAQIVGGLQSPMSGVVGVLNAPATDVVGVLNAVSSNIVYVLQARIDQMQAEGQSA